MKSNQEALRERVYNYYLLHRAEGKLFTVNHFKTESISQSGIYNIIQRAENESGHERVQGSGRIAKIMTKPNVRRLEAFFDHKDGVSQHQAARKFNCTQQFISKTLRAKTSIKSRKKMRIPKRTESQKAKAKTRCGRLYRKYAKSSFIIDDESYFTLSHSTINGNNIFYSSDVSQTCANVKYCPVQKFEPKLLVWLAFSEKGISKPLFRKSGFAITGNVYLEECIKQRLEPFIAAHHSDGQYVFWPDLASAHYAAIVTDYMKLKNVNFVAKDDNPPNLPECRPIENFWSLLKGKVYKNNWQAKDLNQLCERIKKCLKEIDQNLVHTLARSTLAKIDHVRRNGVIEIN
jgi:hypothetical protein